MVLINVFVFVRIDQDIIGAVLYFGGMHACMCEYMCLIRAFNRNGTGELNQMMNEEKVNIGYSITIWFASVTVDSALYAVYLVVAFMVHVHEFQMHTAKTPNVFFFLVIAIHSYLLTRNSELQFLNENLLCP